MKKRNYGFTLTELLVVIAIIGILGVVALPYYTGHIVKSRLAEVENAMTVLKSAVSAYHQDNEAFPNCINIAMIQSSLGVGLLAVTRVSSASITNGVITTVIDHVDPMVDGKTLILTPTESSDGSLTWAWGWSADFPRHLTPMTR